MSFCPIPGCKFRLDPELPRVVCAYHTAVATHDPSYVISQLNAELHCEEIAAIKAGFPYMKTSPKKNGAEVKSAPSKLTQQTKVQSNPLAGKSWVLEVNHGQLRSSETNPRKDFAEKDILDLAVSFRLQGQLQNILVRPCPKWLGRELGRLKALEAKGKLGNLGTLKIALELIVGTFNPGRELTAKELAAVDGALKNTAPTFEIVAGERRWRAAGAKYAKLEKVRVDIRCLTDDQVIEAQFEENFKRVDISPLEEAEGFQRLIDTGKWTAATICERFSKDRSTLFARLKLNRLGGPARDALKEGRITATHAELISTIPDHKAQAEFLKKEVFNRDGEPQSVRCLAEEMERRYVRPLKGVPWKVDCSMSEDGFKKHNLPACVGCPHNTRNMEDSKKGPERCVQLSCFEQKMEIALKEAKTAAVKDGLEVVTDDAASDWRFQERFCLEGKKDYTQSKPWEELAKNVPHSIVALTKEGPKRVWAREDLLKAGVIKKEPSYSSGPTKSPAQRRKELEEATAARAVTSAVVTSAELADPSDTEILRLLAHAFLASAWSDTTRVMAKRRGVEKQKIVEKEFVAQLTSGECIGILVEGLCCAGMRGGWNAEAFQKDALSLFKIDAKEIGSAAIAAMSSKKNGKPAKSDHRRR